MESLPLGQKKALVCGASSGIGRACALALARLGAEVVLVARRRELLQELARAIREDGGLAVVLPADLDAHEALEAAVDAVLGQGPVTILLNNTGGPAPGPLLEATPEAFTAAFRRHVLVAHLLTGKCLPGMRKAGYGRIINIISTSVREPLPQLGVSNTIRGAMAAWAKTLSKELPPGITVNNVLPGLTDTPRLADLREEVARQRGCTAEDVLQEWLSSIPEGRLARPEEVAAAVAFLATPSAEYIRGHSLPVDGGRLQSIA